MDRLRIRPPPPIERAELDRWTWSGKTAWYQWARTILLAADTGALGTEMAQARSGRCGPLTAAATV